MYPSLAFGASIDSLDILVIDENRGMQRILAAVLRANRIRRVRTGSDANKAMDDMIAVPPDILIIDWSMRESDAETLIRTMRNAAMHPLCFIPVICFALAVSRSAIVEILEAGATTVLRKPVATHDLLEHVEWITRDARSFRLDGSRYVLPTPKTVVYDVPIETELFMV